MTTRPDIESLLAFATRELDRPVPGTDDADGTAYDLAKGLETVCQYILDREHLARPDKSAEVIKAARGVIDAWDTLPSHTIPTAALVGAVFNLERRLIKLDHASTSEESASPPIDRIHTFTVDLHTVCGDPGCSSLATRKLLAVGSGPGLESQTVVLATCEPHLASARKALSDAMETWQSLPPEMQAKIRLAQMFGEHVPTMLGLDESADEDTP